jgi:Ca2+-transporting ATPase
VQPHAPRSPGARDTGAPPPWHARSADETLAALGSGAAGLDDTEAARRLRRYGPNLLQAARPTPAWRILLDQLRSIVVLLLLAASVVALAMGDHLEAAAIGAVLVLNTVLGFVTELRARRAMEGLLKLEVPRATVVRGGATRDIEASRLVPGDVIAVEAGQSVPADARILSAADLRVDEAPLTGESVPVDKTPDTVHPDAIVAERANLLHKGTAVVAGSGRGVVVATGMDTQVGHIGRLVGGIADERTPLERRLDALGRRLVWLTLGVAVVVAAAGVARGFELLRMVETGIALAIAAVPEGLTAVVTIALSVGLRRMARRRALIRRLPAVEALGSATVIASDKTGTLTAGEQTVTHLWTGSGMYELSGAGYEPRGEINRDGRRADAAGDPLLARALRVAALTNHADVEERDGDWIARGDPTEAALLVAARKGGLDRAALLEQWPLEREVPFSSERKLMATFHRAPEGGTVVLVKGAPGEVVRRCTAAAGPGSDRPLDAAGREQLLARNRELAASGLRVLALASGTVDAAAADPLADLVFLGFAGIIDPPAEGVRETVRLFRGAGIRTVMITGDQKLTAEAIGRELGVLAEDAELLDGAELARLGDDELARRVGRIAGFSRVSPEDKLRIVTAYQAHGEIVAMLGDGVNDAAALKKADIGVAMGVRGTDVAKEAADVILQDDRFRTIAAAVEEGRVIYDNIRKFVFYLFSCNLAEVLVLLVTSLAGLPLPLLPLQILWLNLVTDTLPALALALEPADAGVMARPPRDPAATLLSRRALGRIGLYGALITAVTLAAFIWGLATADDEPRAVTLAFMTLALAQIFHLGNARSGEHVVSAAAALRNPWAVGAIAVSLALQALAIYLPALARVLHTRPLGLTEWLVALGLAALPAVIGQAARLIRPGAVFA